MTKTVTAGLVLAVAAAAALLIGDGLGWDLDGVLFLGIGVGGALGLIPDKTPVARILGLLLGLLAAAIGYALRAAVFPDNTTARAVAVALVVLIAMGFVLLTFGRIAVVVARHDARRTDLAACHDRGGVRSHCLLQLER